jgi:tol-pal system protein YbgF
VVGRILLACLAGGVLAGCAPQLDRIEAELAETNSELAEIRKDQQEMREQIEKVNHLFRIDQNTDVQSTAQRMAKIDQLSQKITQLMLKLDDNNEYMRSLSARVDLLATRAGIPTLGEYKGTGQNPGEYDPLPEEGRAIFQAAQLDRNRGNNDMAKEGFTEFLDKYGNSELADDALYWLGDLAYGEEQFEAALTHFEKLLNDYPFSDHCPAAMLKSAYTLQALGRNQESGAQFQKLIDVYPESAEAALAKERLESD